MISQKYLIVFPFTLQDMNGKRRECGLNGSFYKDHREEELFVIVYVSVSDELILHFQSKIFIIRLRTC